MKTIIAAEAALRDFDDFYRAEYPSVYRAAFMITGERESALDATQEAFKRAYARWRRLAKEPWRGGWVMTTALNLCKSTRQKARRETPVPVFTGADASNTPVTRVDVVDALRRLPKRQRTAVVLFYIGDLPLPAIAHLMGISDGTVKAHLAQGRAALRDLLEVRDD